MSSDLQLTLSDRAKRRIAAMLSEFRDKFGKEAIPALMWIDSALNKGLIESQPAIGFYVNRDDIAPHDLLHIDGMEIAIAVSEQDMIRFRDKILDYERGCFFLR